LFNVVFLPAGKFPLDAPRMDLHAEAFLDQLRQFLSPQ
jgi:hypothetical protein